MSAAASPSPSPSPYDSADMAQGKVTRVAPRVMQCAGGAAMHAAEQHIAAIRQRGVMRVPSSGAMPGREGPQLAQFERHDASPPRKLPAPSFSIYATIPSRPQAFPSPDNETHSNFSAGGHASPASSVQPETRATHPVEHDAASGPVDGTSLLQQAAQRDLEKRPATITRPHYASRSISPAVVGASVQGRHDWAHEALGGIIEPHAPERRGSPPRQNEELDSSKSGISPQLKLEAMLRCRELYDSASGVGFKASVHATKVEGEVPRALSYTEELNGAGTDLRYESQRRVSPLRARVNQMSTSSRGEGSLVGNLMPSSHPHDGNNTLQHRSTPGRTTSACRLTASTSQGREDDGSRFETFMQEDVLVHKERDLALQHLISTARQQQSQLQQQREILDVLDSSYHDSQLQHETMCARFQQLAADNEVLMDKVFKSQVASLSQAPRHGGRDVLLPAKHIMLDTSGEVPGTVDASNANSTAQTMSLLADAAVRGSGVSAEARRLAPSGKSTCTSPDKGDIPLANTGKSAENLWNSSDEKPSNAQEATEIMLRMFVNYQERIFRAQTEAEHERFRGQELMAQVLQLQQDAVAATRASSSPTSSSDTSAATGAGASAGATTGHATFPSASPRRPSKPAENGANIARPPDRSLHDSLIDEYVKAYDGTSSEAPSCPSSASETGSASSSPEPTTEPVHMAAEAWC